MITVQVDASRVVAKIERIDEATRTALRGAIVSITRDLTARVLAKLSGGVLNYRSGDLYRSINANLVENPTSIYGRVFSDGSVKYARIHEFGGTIQHPGSSKFQAWQGPAGWVYTHFTRPHAIPMPERSYLRSSLAEMQADIVTRLTTAVKSSVKAL
jgi:phage gpG-like protein